MSIFHFCSEEDLTIVKKGKPINFFILVIEGRVEVNIGREELTFESGPFSYFGIQTLSQVLPSITSGLVVDRYFLYVDLVLAYPRSHLSRGGIVKLRLPITFLCSRNVKFFFTFMKPVVPKHLNKSWGVALSTSNGLTASIALNWSSKL